MISKKEYESIHAWLRRTFGSAATCEGVACQGTSGRFEWALKAGFIHARNRDNYLQLCQACHRAYDAAHGNKGRKTGWTYHDEDSVPVRISMKAYETLVAQAAKDKRTIIATVDLLLGV